MTKINNKNKLFLISGHSGSGKSSLMKSLMDNMIISTTTRDIRQGEEDGVDYYFISETDHHNILTNKGYAEHTRYSGNFYGITKDEVDIKLQKGHAYAIVDYNGMLQLKKYYDNVVTIMLHTSEEDAVLQMLKRGDKMSGIEERLKTYQKELQNKQFYDYCILNRHGKFEETRFILNSILQTEMDKLEEI